MRRRHYTYNQEGIFFQKNTQLHLKRLTVCYKSILRKEAFFVKKIHNFIPIRFPLPLQKPFTRGFRSVG